MTSQVQLPAPQLQVVGVDVDDDGVVGCMAQQLSPPKKDQAVQI
jgi:hypothetical protein